MYGVIGVKRGVHLPSSPIIWWMIGRVYEWWVDTFDFSVPFVITSGMERVPVHAKRSLHYYGLAIDIRTRDLVEDDKARARDELKGMLNPFGFDVVLESTHLHIEHDPYSGRVMWELLEEVE